MLHAFWFLEVKVHACPSSSRRRSLGFAVEDTKAQWSQLLARRPGLTLPIPPSTGEPPPPIPVQLFSVKRQMFLIVFLGVFLFAISVSMFGTIWLSTGPEERSKAAFFFFS